MTHPLTATVLVIDDQDDNLALLEALLESQGFTALLADNGPTGIELALTERPDLILLDIAMPGMDGFAVLEALGKAPVTRRIPVIVLTAHQREAAMIERGLALGATEYLNKPIKHDELLVRIRTALRLAAAEQELEQLRRDFAAMLVHDMRAPLDGVRLTLNVLKRQEAEGSPRTALLLQATGALDGLGTLIEEILQVHSLETEGFVPDTQTFDLTGLVAEALLGFLPLADARGVALAIDTPVHALGVEADPLLTRRIIENIVGNALKFTTQGRVTVSLRHAGDTAHVSIQDTGPGLPAEALPRMFERDFHVERRRETHQGGFGLGLAFCGQAIAAMHGQIGVDSEPGQGCRFWFELPLARA